MKVKIEAIVDDLGERITGDEVMKILSKEMGLNVEFVSIHEDYQGVAMVDLDP